MKIYWSAFLSLLLLLALTGCGAEQFGTTPQSNTSNPTQVSSFQQASCSGNTTINPKVDILYLVDNSTSSYYVASDIKSAIQNTISSISNQFDYRVIGAPLIATAGGNDDYQVLAKSALPASIPSSKVVSSASQFSFFSNLAPSSSVEAGLGRLNSFLIAHQNDLFRQGAYLLVVLVSNGRDNEVEYVPQANLVYGVNAETVQNSGVFADRKATLLNIKAYLQSQQLRLFSITADSRCISGYQPSTKSYAAMSQALNPSEVDHRDLCTAGGSIGSLFSGVNSSIQQVIIPHKYNRWPITFSETPTGLNVGDIKVYKSSPTSAPTLLPSSAWTYINNASYNSYDTRVAPSVGEPTSARHLIQFTSGNEVTYPDCIQITSTSNLEYFGYVVLPKIPKLDSIVLKINGQSIPASGSNGYSYIGQQTRNIKVNHNGFSDTPVAIRSGYMLQLNGSGNYYKSGDNVEIYYIPATN